MHLGHETCGKLELTRLPRESAIEVDDVEPVSALVGEARGDSSWVGAIRDLALEVTLAQSDDQAATKINGGQHLEGCHEDPWPATFALQMR
jgi:hypothetical protein